VEPTAPVANCVDPTAPLAICVVPTAPVGIGWKVGCPPLVVAAKKNGAVPVAEEVEENSSWLEVFVVMTDDGRGKRSGCATDTSETLNDLLTALDSSWTSMVSLSNARSMMLAGNLSPVVNETSCVSGLFLTMEIVVVVGTAKKIVTLPPRVLFAPVTE
jgi:hypothetical protein